MTPQDWETRNRDLLVAELTVLRARLRAGDESGYAAGVPPLPDAELAREAAADALGGESALDQLCAGFMLTPFERSVLLLAAGPELVADFARDLAVAGGSERATFGLALAALPDAHWSAMTPTGPLRRWNLVELLDTASPTTSPLAIDERVLHHLVGAGHLDAGLGAMARPVLVPDWLPEPFTDAARTVIRVWEKAHPVLLHGPQPDNVRAVAALAADAAGLSLMEVGITDLPGEPRQRDRMIRRMERETVLAARAWAVDVGVGSADELSPRLRALPGFDAPLVLLSSSGGSPGWSDIIPIAVDRLGVRTRRELLRVGLDGAGVSVDQAEIARAAGIFDLSINAAASAAVEVAAGTDLWSACRRQVRRGFDGLAEVRSPRVGWDSLVLPAGQLEQLHALVAAARNRATVLDEWGFGDRLTRGLGTTALFAGPSGTGKTLAAEVIAHELGVDLVHVDLSAVVSKYIGETEKQLRRLFDAAENGGTVLLFDEADALFGKRTEVRDSHDRYANLEVGYLLQRMESFHGLAILTTNARTVLDKAFLRRIQTVVTFPYPNRQARESLWRNVFPDRVPLRGVNPATLADIDLSGGGIAAAALVAAYLGAEEGDEVTGEHVASAAKWELAKNNRVQVGQLEFGGPTAR
ncbi:ATP-binding protein [Mycolicibacterium celeriflavum]|uniref:ATP-binding protein n=1 Tax=Mycolicibacterium celeriflavum TaxID=1249101 RepID=UPI003CE6FB9E